MFIDYNITRDYCSEWTAIDAIREIAQNALDSGRDFTCTADDHEISVVTNGVVLQPNMFALGYSSKGSNSVGQYGEGFKIGMMILTREGNNPMIDTGEHRIKGEFRYNEMLGVETFCLVFTKLKEPVREVDFLCSADGIDIGELRKRVTPFSAEPLDTPVSVDILYDRPGMVYVNGLYVCEDDKLTYGYNFAPSRIQLNRDRNMTSGLESVLAQYFVEFGKAETIFNLLENDARDTSYVYIWLHRKPELKAELSRLFYNKYGEGAQIGKPGTSYIGTHRHVSCGTSMYQTMTACGVAPAVEKEDPNSPVGIVKTFIDENKKHMRRRAIANAETLINQAKAWAQK